MRRRIMLAATVGLAALLTATPAGAVSLSIYDIQYTTAADGASPQDGNTIDCLGGVVTHTWAGGKARVYLQDPARTEWAGIMVKDWTGTVLPGVALGDWVSLSNVVVEESRGNTILKFHTDYASGFAIVSSGNAVSAPVVVTPSAIAAPAEGPPGEWYVADHSAEKYEHMWVAVEGVTVAGMGLGHVADNYVLSDGAGECWASDYMNADVGADGYDHQVAGGASVDRVTGIFEQYTHLPSFWDHYQIVTTKTGDLVPDATTAIILLAGSTGVLRQRRRSRRYRKGERP